MSMLMTIRKNRPPLVDWGSARSEGLTIRSVIASSSSFMLWPPDASSPLTREWVAGQGKRSVFVAIGVLDPIHQIIELGIQILDHLPLLEQGIGFANPLLDVASFTLETSHLRDLANDGFHSNSSHACVNGSILLGRPDVLVGG